MDDGPDGLGDLLQHPSRVEGRDKLLADVQEASFGRDLLLEEIVLALEGLDVVGVDDGLCGVPSEDRQGPLVIRTVLVRAGLGDYEHPLDRVAVGHRHQ